MDSETASPEKQKLYSVSENKDTGYAWLVCGAAFCNLFITLGLHYSCGVIFVTLLDTFGESKADTGTQISTWTIAEFLLV